MADETPSALARDSSGDRAPPSGLGFALREARVHLGLQLSDVETRTGVQAKYLRALEWERFDLLPSERLRRSAVTAYADAVGLDTELVRSLGREQTPDDAAMSAAATDLARRIGVPPADRPPTDDKPVTDDQPVPPPDSVRDGGATESFLEQDGGGGPSTRDLASGTPAEPSAERAPSSEDLRPWAVTEPRGLDWRRHDAGPPARVGTNWSGLLRSGSERQATMLYRLLVGAVLLGIAAFIAVDVLAGGDEPEAPASPAAPVPEVAPPAAVLPPPAVTDQAGEPPAPPAPAATAERTPAPASPATPDAASSPAAATPTAPTTAANAPAPTKFLARGGESWLQVRANSRQGRVLFEGILAAGDSVEFDRRRLWARLGAPASVRIRRDGKRISPRGLTGPVDLLVTPAGVRDA